MIITVDRITSDNDATLSIVSVDSVFSCFGLEDEYRVHKIPGNTRIPAGKYSVGVRDTGGFHNRYTNKFPDFHRGMLQILDVPGFEYILIHIGNTDEDTEGCLLVGSGANTGDNLSISNSVKAYKMLYTQVIDAALAGELTIEYTDNDETH